MRKFSDELISIQNKLLGARRLKLCSLGVKSVIFLFAKKVLRFCRLDNFLISSPSMEFILIGMRW